MVMLLISLDVLAGWCAQDSVCIHHFFSPVHPWAFNEAQFIEFEQFVCIQKKNITDMHKENKNKKSNLL